MHIDEFLKYFDRVRKMGNGWQARCPAHEDRNPSLSINVTGDGHILVNCHAHCKTEDVVKAVGLSMCNLMPADGDRAVAQKQSRRITRCVATWPNNGVTFPTMQEAIAAYDSRLGPHAAQWNYAKDGEVLGAVVRWNRPDGEKEIRPVALRDGGWTHSAMPAPRPLYQLGELSSSAGNRVYVVEGEKAADAARSIRLIATTSAGGAKSAAQTDWRPLAGRDVVILPDNDEAGHSYAEDVASSLQGLRQLTSVRSVELPDLPPSGDIADFIEARRAAGLSNEAIRAEIESLAAAAQPEGIGSARPAPMAYESFPIGVFAGAVREFVRVAAGTIGCDIAFIALPVLSALAAAIGNSRRLQLKAGWTEPAVVWTANVGESGSHKSPALQAAVSPVRRRQQEAMRRYKQEQEAYERAMDTYDRDLLGWKKAGRGTPPPEKPVKPVADRAWSDDVTMEGMVQLLSDQPRGLLLVRDELSGWLDGFDKYTKGGGEAAKWLEMHGARELLVDRKSSGATYVPRAAVSIAGGIQPEVLRRALSREYRENGLAARLLLAHPPRMSRRWTEQELPPAIQLAYQVVLDQLYGLQMDTDQCGEPAPTIMRLDPDAKAIWITFFNEHGHEQVELGGDLAAAWSKLEGYAARFAMILHLTRWACQEETAANPDEVDAISMRAGIVLARWFGHETKRVYAMLHEDEEQTAQRRLLDLVTRHGGSISVRELMRADGAYPTADAATVALEALADHGHGSWRYEPTNQQGGRPTKRFTLNGDLPADATAARTGDDGGCVGVGVSAEETGEV